MSMQCASQKCRAEICTCCAAACEPLQQTSIDSYDNKRSDGIVSTMSGVLEYCTQHQHSTADQVMCMPLDGHKPFEIRNASAKNVHQYCMYNSEQ